VKVERQYAPALPEIQADRQLCEQVFVNLITNAYQAMEGQAASSNGTPDGNPVGALNGVLRLSIAPEVSSGEPGVCVTVEDSGPGVPPEMREQIFNPFFTSKKDGVGLGLSIVAKIVDDHRGKIRLDSDSTQGARFRVFFPHATPN
jgi:signal transduction histidine kinase